MKNPDHIMRCEHKNCITPSIGYGCRELQGPFYCQAHKDWAIEQVAEFYRAVQDDIDEERARLIYDYQTCGEYE